MFIITRRHGYEDPEVVAIRKTQREAIKRAKKLADLDLIEEEPEEIARSINNWQEGDLYVIEAIGDDGVICSYEIREITDDKG